MRVVFDGLGIVLDGRGVGVARVGVWVEGMRWCGGHDGDWRGCAWSLLGDATAGWLDGGHDGCTERPLVDVGAAAGSRRRRGGVHCRKLRQVSVWAAPRSLQGNKSWAAQLWCPARPGMLLGLSNLSAWL